MPFRDCQADHPKPYRIKLGIVILYNFFLLFGIVTEAHFIFALRIQYLRFQNLHFASSHLPNLRRPHLPMPTRTLTLFPYPRSLPTQQHGTVTTESNPRSVELPLNATTQPL